MMEISVSNLVMIFGFFFLLGMGIGIFTMVGVVKRELEKQEGGEE